MFGFLGSNRSKGSVEPYSLDLQLYKYCPDGNISLAELKTICIDRAKVLFYVEKIYKAFGSKKAWECKACLIDTLKKNGYTSFAKIINGASKEFGSEAEAADKILQLRRQDHISHYMLLTTLAAHSTKTWFYAQELQLFYWRLYSLTIEEMKEFLHVNKLRTINISEEDRKDLDLYIKESNLSNEIIFYKVPFPLVTDLIIKHKVFLKSGMAFVQEKQFIQICIGYFKENLDFNLSSTSLVAAESATDIRMKRIFNALIRFIILEKRAMQGSYAPLLEEFDEVSKISYPLCMKIIHEKLRESHHLLYGERIQYGLFLKSIGVTLEDNLELWKQEFVKTTNIALFEKEYGYRLRHVYGEEGSRKEYRCYNCIKIICLEKKPNEFHGCPFEYLENSVLKQKLSDYKFKPVDIEDIVQLKSLNYYQTACKKYYEITHNCKLDNIFNTPKDYFNESEKTKRVIKDFQL